MRKLSAQIKIVYSAGDHTVNLVLGALTLHYLFFLTTVAGLDPLLAGIVPWVGRVVDAITDPLMGRLSDRTRWKRGRRRPYFLIGVLPFGIFFALLWVDAPFASETARFVFYCAVYVGLSLAMTVLSVPYLALIPEMARNYDERTSLNTYRTAGGILATFLAVTLSGLAAWFGGGIDGWSSAGLAVAVWLVVPWFPVYLVSWERGGYRTGSQLSLREGLRTLANQQAYRTLAAFYLLARVAVDIVGATFIFYIAYVIGRPEDFSNTMFLFLTVVMVALPLWLNLARRFDKRGVFRVGVLWWIGAQIVMFFGSPEWSSLTLYAVAACAGVGYAVADLMPWSMLPDVIDQDEAETGERREGLYNGLFTFLRKLGGASAVLCIGLALKASGYDGDLDQQPDSAVTAIRFFMALVPALLLASSVWIARRYPLDRTAHRQILRRLDEAFERRSSS